MASLEENKEMYLKCLHAVQTGIAYKMQYDLHETTPKHLRTGINNAIVSNTALVRLLIRKGLITEDEYFESLVAEMKMEVNRYEEWLSKRLNAKIILM